MDLATWLVIIVAVQTASLVVGILRFGLAWKQDRRQRRIRADLDRILKGIPQETMSVEGG